MHTKCRNIEYTQIQNDLVKISRLCKTYTRKFKVAITALGCRCQLFDVMVYGLATRGLNYTPAVRLGVVRLALAESNALGHCELLLHIFESGDLAEFLVQKVRRSELTMTYTQ